MSFFGELWDGLSSRQQPWERALGNAKREHGVSSAMDLPRVVRAKLLREQVTADGPIEPDLNAYLTTHANFGPDALAPLIEEGVVVVDLEVKTEEWPYRKTLTPREAASRLREEAVRSGWNSDE